MDFWFLQILGSCIVLGDKLGGILDRLNLSLDRCFENISIQTDNLEAIHAVQNETPREPKSALIRRVHQLLGKVRLRDKKEGIRLLKGPDWRV
ncbi:hypothetical protein PVK06_023747 [Gossypium arboreum]|uniref:Uncharacterized protein n=1 Tax=Gossypium arboreum TaxID=29729 RepID=A0ABR0PCC0_GOSAR|nr:hypothetical protein PVK06_023747 [Gossypium arboreum]